LLVGVEVEVNYLVMVGLVEVVQAGLELAQGYLSQQERLIPLRLAGAVLVRLRDKTTEVKVLILLSLVRLLQKTLRVLELTHLKPMVVALEAKEQQMEILVGLVAAVG
jgi:hypothetical protein